MSSFDQANIPDLEEFSKRVEEAAAAAKQFADSSGQQQPSSDTVNTKSGNVSSDSSDMSKDILSALSAIHDEAIAIKDLLNKLMGS